jgi:hypothetical protein
LPAHIKAKLMCFVSVGELPAKIDQILQAVAAAP